MGGVDFGPGEIPVPATLLPLLPGEQRAIQCVQKGTAVDLAVNDASEDDPVNSSAWNSERQLRADFLRWLLVESNSSEHLPNNRLAVRGAKIIGTLDLSHQNLQPYLFFHECSFSAGFRIPSSQIRGLEFRKVALGGVAAGSASIEGPLIFDTVRFYGPLQLSNSKITGDLAFRCCELPATGPYGILALNSSIDGSIFFYGTRSLGGLNFINTRVKGDLSIEATEIRGSIYADGINVEGRCFIRNGTNVFGKIQMLGGKIGGELSLGGARIEQRGHIVLDLRRIQVGGAVFLNRGFHAEGGVAFYGAKIGGDCNLSSARISNPFKIALDLPNSEIEGALHLAEGCVIEGSINLYGSVIDGDLNCPGAQIGSSQAFAAIDLRRSRIRGAVFFTDGFSTNGRITGFASTLDGNIAIVKAHLRSEGTALEMNASKLATFQLQETEVNGRIELVGAELVGDLIITKTEVSAPGTVLNFDYIKARNLVIGQNTRLVGATSLYAASFSGDVSVRESRMKANDPNRIVFDARRMNCVGTLTWLDLESEPTGVVQLEQAHVGGLHDDLSSWPAEVRLDGFTYDRIVGDSPKTVEQRIGWLAKQKKYYSQPYEHLIATYRKVGDAESAAEVAIRKWRTRRSEMRKWSIAWLWDYFLDVASGYGYRPWRPVVALLVLLGLGALVYYAGEQNDAFCEIDTLRLWPHCSAVPPEFPQFSPSLYSFETLVPLADFGQKRFYFVRADTPAGHWVGVYTIFHRGLGWILSLLLALAPTNVLKRE